MPGKNLYQVKRFRSLLSLLWFHDLCLQFIISVLCFFKIRAVIGVVLEQLLKTLNIHVRSPEAFWQKYQWPRIKPNFLEVLAKFFFCINKQNILNNIVYKFQNTHFPNKMKTAQIRF